MAQRRPTDSSEYGIKRILVTAGKPGTLDDFKPWRSRKVASCCTQSDPHRAPMLSYAQARGMIQTNPFILGNVKSFLSPSARTRSGTSGRSS